MSELKRPSIYLDYAAGTPIDPLVRHVMDAYTENNFSHTSSVHQQGRAAKSAREDARFKIAAHIEARSEECHFTYGGSDGMMKAIYGVINALREKGITESEMHIVMSVIEHASVRACVEGLARRGIAVSVVGVETSGVIDREQLIRALRKDTVLVITMLANNEIGTVQPIALIRKDIETFYATSEHRHSASGLTRPVLLSDASQATLALSINTHALQADILAFDAHKFYGPFATGLLYVKTGTPFIGLCGAPGKPGHEGTPDVASVLGMAEAWNLLKEHRDANVTEWNELKTYFIQALTDRFADVRIHGDPNMSLPSILNISFPNVEGEFLVTQLDKAGIATSAKSACLSEGGEGSYVVQAIDPSRANNSIRFSFGRTTTKDDIDYTVSVLADIVKK